MSHNITQVESYRYVGSHPKLQSKTALGWTDSKGVFRVQVDQRPCTIDHVKWAYGWHITPRSGWERKHL
jgi:hypothetical protein